MKRYFEVYQGSKIYSGVLMMVLNGSAIPCGSGCFQDASGSQWLGKPSVDAIKNAQDLLKSKATKSGVRVQVQEFLNYVGE